MYKQFGEQNGYRLGGTLGWTRNESVLIEVLCKYKANRVPQWNFPSVTRWLPWSTSVKRVSLLIKSSHVLSYEMWYLCMTMDLFVMTESTTSKLDLEFLLSIGRDGQLHIYDNVTISISTSQTFRFPDSNIPSHACGVFISQLIQYVRDCSSYECFIPRSRNFKARYSQARIRLGMIKIIIKEVLGSIRGSY